MLLVSGDEPLPPVFAAFADEPQAAYAVALLLDGSAGTDAIAFQLEGEDRQTRGGETTVSWPCAAEFLRSLSAEPALALPHAGWRWTRCRDSGELSGMA